MKLDFEHAYFDAVVQNFNHYARYSFKYSYSILIIYTQLSGFNYFKQSYGFK